jgi:hypothetical protein
MLPPSIQFALIRFPGTLILLFFGIPNLLAVETNSIALEHFEKRIRPLFEEVCMECHGSEKQKGGLRLDFREAWQIGGDSGPALVPGDLDSSRLIHAIRYGDADFQMPPKNKLSTDQIADLEQWVAMGAPDPRSGTLVHKKQSEISIEKGRTFWSFQPIQNPRVPSSSNPDQTETAIDAFARSKQESKGLSPAPIASPSKLLRRAYFTLIGIPPTPEQIETFVSGSRPDAFENLVDELLASPHYGERWGRHWLDIARFAESSGGGRTLLFKDAWRYRDYVIEAFNADMPFDQFISEQLAGDLLPYTSANERSRQLTATAFLALGLTNYELQDKQLLRYDVIDEQIDTLGKAFLGMTLGCARCHDHKFDPIPTADYYALAGIFKSTRTLYNYTDNVARWVDTPLPLAGEAGAELGRYESERALLALQLNRKMAALALLDQSDAKVPQPGQPKSVRLFPGIVLDESSAKKEGEWLFSQYSQNYLNEGYLNDGNKYKGENALVFETSLPLKGRYEIRLAYAESDNRSTQTPISIRHSQGETRILVDQSQPPLHYGRFQSLGTFDYEANANSVVRISNGETDGYVVADAVQWLLVSDEAEQKKPEREQLVTELEKETKQLGKDLKLITAKLKARPLAMTVKDDPEPSDSAIRVRGIESRKGDIVPRGFLQIASTGDPPIISESSSGRKELAQWIASPQNPLTARVLANRVWTWLFGKGLVSSVDNFGTTGDPPSHPELLDYLATRLIESDWSIKSLIREIMLTQTWQLSTEATANAKASDPNNRLLSSYPLRRLDAEQLRDAILATNGELELKMFGPNIEGAGEINANSTTAQTTEYNYVFKDKRRSVYTPAFRVKRHELFELFDFGNANFTIGQRNTSTVALQALYLLNNPFVINQSRIAAQRLLRKVDRIDHRIDFAFQSALGRPPSDSERRLVVAFLKDGLSSESVEDWASVYQSLFGSIDFRYLN